MTEHTRKTVDADAARSQLETSRHRRQSLLILLVGLPLFVVAAISIMGFVNRVFGRLPLPAELVVYAGLGVIWVLPFRAVFRAAGGRSATRHKSVQHPLPVGPESMESKGKHDVVGNVHPVPADPD